MTAEVAPPAVELIEPSAAFDAMLRGEPCTVLGMGEDQGLSPERWQADADVIDDQLLRRCRGATVDIGCGPGRMAAALARRGMTALGIDVAAEAVRQTRARGAVALQRDVFAQLPGEGRWNTALLADGNIGIAGDPVRLLRRVSEILAPDGRIVLDVSGPGGEVSIHRLRLEVAGGRSRPFRWAVVPADRLAALAHEASLRLLELSSFEGRWVAQLVKGGAPAARRP